MVVSDYSKLVKKLSIKVFTILSSEPIDVIEDDGSAVYQCQSWELCSPRKDNSLNIGSANFMIANDAVIKYVHDLKDVSPYQTGQILFKSVLTLLEANKQIRQSPIMKRKGFKVITNDRKET